MTQPGSRSLWNFYPRPPRGGRRPNSGGRIRSRSISIHALREEGDLRPAGITRKAIPISIHALREEGDVMGL